jgi:vitamin B12 transporter
MPFLPIDTAPIVVTASRAPQKQDETAASTTVIDGKTIDRLGDPLVDEFLRLTPSAAVETSGPPGSFAEVRIRGAEANHTLLFIDGIRANDPAANDTPRFELLNADLAARIEVVRGPQSALWGSDAIGGVITVNGVPPERSAASAAVEAGSFGFARSSASGTLVRSSASLEAAVGFQQATGIDSYNGEGDRDGYRNLSGRVRGSWQVAPQAEVGASAFSLSGRSQFDGFDPVTFVHADTLDSSRNRLSAGRLWLAAGSSDSGVSGTIAVSLLGSSNRNLLDGSEINETRGQRRSTSAQAQYIFATGPIRHTIIAALDDDRESFHARDTIYLGGSNQDRRRSHQALTAEWRSEVTRLTTDVAVRRDWFSAFEDATTLRASALVALGGGFSAAASYSEGIAQPTFFDLYGFFPGTFTGNPLLKPESSRGYEVSLRYRRGEVSAAITGYTQRLSEEIVDVFDPVTSLSSTINRDSLSHRSGIEAELAWRVGDRLHLMANYAYLDATEPGAVPGTQFREVRRPKCSASLAADGLAGKLSYGASLAYVGRRSDTNFNAFPAQRVRLKAYWLAGARLGYALTNRLELFGRVSNLFNARYQDVFGYRTEGRGIYAGLRLGNR